jgi:hypothetical protein
LAETTPGGRYRTADGRLVNANGEPIKQVKKDAEADAPAVPRRAEAEQPEPTRRGR